MVRFAIKMASGARRPWMAERREDGSPKGAETGKAGLGLRQPAPEGHAQDLTVHFAEPLDQPGGWIQFSVPTLDVINHWRRLGVGI